MEDKDPHEPLDEVDLEEIAQLAQEEYTELSSDEQQRLNEYVQALAALEQARSDRWKRALFERAPPETLAFIVYSVFVSADALGAIVAILIWGQSLNPLPFLVLVALAMLAPLPALPKTSAKETVVWIKDAIRALFSRPS